MLIHSAPESTVGAAGLALRYANVIIMAETYFYSTTTTSMSKGAREYMFEMQKQGKGCRVWHRGEELGATKLGCKAHGFDAANVILLGFGENGGCDRGDLGRVELYM
ncbi:hypothetical protein F3Y22_tig00110118pilonHSYRG00111 [Hibiscus syriacus]|uniref:DUF668 domain-containing protein n=1 Tax=Hibiscus syriacus TaxID=106335 RepID=A0A6A3BK48_HIBSY|nr:hypothetical protein F3Y22_tig00110118pilonHSYRG00111 [Hibiscus syriacus]